MASRQTDNSKQPIRGGLAFLLARRAQETEQRLALYNTETDAEETQVQFKIYFMSSIHFGDG